MLAGLLTKFLIRFPLGRLHGDLKAVELSRYAVRSDARELYGTAHGYVMTEMIPILLKVRY